MSKVNRNFDTKSDTKESQYSVFDFLVDRMPGLLAGKSASAEKAELLYNLWKDSKNKVSERVYRKPMNVKSSELKSLESDGFVKTLGDKVKITSKGDEVIKKMVLGDDRSSFEDDGTPPDYQKALSKTSQGNSQRKQEDAWWGLALSGTKNTSEANGKKFSGKTGGMHKFSQANKLNSLKKEINNEFKSAGLNGQSEFDKQDKALGKTKDVLSSYGLQAEEGFSIEKFASEGDSSSFKVLDANGDQVGFVWVQASSNNGRYTFLANLV